MTNPADDPDFEKHLKEVQDAQAKVREAMERGEDATRPAAEAEALMRKYGIAEELPGDYQDY